MIRSTIILIIVAASIGLFYWYTNPQYQVVKELKAEAAQYDQALDNSKELLAVRDTLLSKYNTFRNEDLTRLQKLLPDTVDNVRLVLDLDTIASRYGMRINAVSVGTQGIEERSRTAVGPQDTPYGSVILTFQVATTYPTFIRFLQDLEQSLRLTDVVSITFAEPRGDLTEYRISLRTYWLK